MRRLLLAACVVGLGVGLACAQTPASQANDPQWKQTPEGRTPEGPQNLNCTGSTSWGKDGKTTTSNCPTAQDQPVPSNAAQQFPYPGEAPKQATPTAPSANAPDAPQAPKNPGKQFPYPGEQPEGSSSSSSSSSSSDDVKPAPPGGLQDAGSSGASSSSSTRVTRVRSPMRCRPAAGRMQTIRFIRRRRGRAATSRRRR